VKTDSPKARAVKPPSGASWTRKITSEFIAFVRIAWAAQGETEDEWTGVQFSRCRRTNPPMTGHGTSASSNWSMPASTAP
jgi:hypothetical protein